MRIVVRFFGLTVLVIEVDGGPPDAVGDALRQALLILIEQAQPIDAPSALADGLRLRADVLATVARAHSAAGCSGGPAGGARKK